MLLFKKIYFDAIRSGRKNTTLRFWRSRRVRPGSVHTVPGLGKIRITDVRAVTLDELTAEDAVNDGFADLNELGLALEQMYPPAERDGRVLYQVHFKTLAE